MKATNAILVCDREISIDRSGVGHCWMTITDEFDLPESVREEIAAEILDGRETCNSYRATNGLCYRW